jgi:ferredoxin
MILLDNDVPEDPDVLELVEQHSAELARLNREGGLAALGVAIAPPPAGSNRYVGEGACRQCHAAAHDLWKKHDHSRAYASLVRRKRDNNPACIGCHVVGLGAGDGFRGINISPERMGVQCESCHGRGGDHVRARRAGAEPAVGKLLRVPPKSCETCHDCVHSPQFVYEPYWERMKHGK